MPSLTPVDDSFFETAPQLFAHTWEIPQPADMVWSQLTGDQPLYWIRGMQASWNTPAPFGVGTERTVTVLGLLKFEEHFYRWEEGRRKTFYGKAMSLPLFTSFAEDYTIEPRDDHSCALTWKIAIKPSLLGRPGAPVNGLVFATAFRDMGKHFRAV